MDNFMGRLLRRAMVVGLVLLAIVCRIVAGALTETAWAWYARWKELPPQAVGAAAQGDTPRAHSIPEMEELALFAVEQGMENWDDDEYFHVGNQNTAYKVLTLDSGERVAARCSVEGSVYDAASGLWTSPVGRWVPWTLEETERASVEWQGLGLTTLDYYVDMLGEERDAAHDGFRLWFPWAGTLGLWVLVVVLSLILRLLLWPVREVTRARGDVELWLAGTHAIWGQKVVRVNQMFPRKGPQPIRFGGLPRTPVARWELRTNLRRVWNIKNYQDLLETVEYMSRGPGFAQCTSQAALAWQLCRCTTLLGIAMVLGWAGRKELVDRSREVGKLIQTHFHSWDELAMGYLEDYTRWCASEGGKDVKQRIQSEVDGYHALKNRADSPYRLPWDLDLDG